MYKHGGRYLDCLSPHWFPFFSLFVHHLWSNGLAHGYPLFGWQNGLVYIRVYTTFLFVFTHIMSLMEVFFGGQQRLQYRSIILRS